MQRWIVMAVVALGLLIGGGGFAYWNYKQNLPHPVWVPLPLNPEVSEAKRDEIVKDLKAKLGTTESLTRISKDLNLAKRWRMASDEEVAGELGRRFFVETAETGKVLMIHVGVRGPRKDKGVSEEIATHLMKDVRKLFGIGESPKRDF